MIFNLDKIAISFAKKIKKSTKKDYPAMVIACMDNSQRFVEKDTSKSHFSGKLNAQLRNLLLVKLGGDCGEKSNITNCKNFIGSCAEVHAVNRLLKKMNNSCDINKIIFSTPIRPRTMQKKDYCSNCRLTFKTLKNK